MDFIVRKLRKTSLFDLYIKKKQRKIIAEQEAVAQLWREKIANYQAGKIDEPSFTAKKPELVGKKIIWQYWGQGIDYDTLPEVILPCFESVDKHKGEFEVIRLDNQTISDYLDIPDYVYQRLEAGGSYTYTFFSDLLRVGLLAIYGGIWMDATIYMTGPIPNYCLEPKFFIYQRDREEDTLVKKYWNRSYYAYWCWDEDFKIKHLTAFIAVREVGLPFFKVMYALLLDYWKTESELKHYFTFQILLTELTEGLFAKDNCPIVSDIIPHLLSSAIAHPNSYIKARQAIKKTSIHKLNSKGAELDSTVNFLWLQKMQY